MTLEEVMKQENLSVRKVAAESGVIVQSLRQYLRLRSEGRSVYLHPDNEEKIIRWSKGKIGPFDLRPYLKSGKKKGKVA